MQLSEDSNTLWGLANKLVFRFFFVFLLLIIFPFPLSLFDFVDDYYSKIWDLLVPLVGQHLLHIRYEISIAPNGSGDRTYDYIILFIYTVLSLTAAFIWALADRKRNNYTTLFNGLSIYVRYYLAFILLGYGFGKIIQTQFPPLIPSQLVDTFGHSTPMGLLWKFMSYSPRYNLFVGAAEVAGGLFLLFRRTSTLGALISMGVMVNVVALNFCYDVPVKIYSSELLLMCFFLLSRDFNRLINFFILNKPVPTVRINPYFERKGLKYGHWIIKTLLIGFALFSNISSQISTQHEMYQRGTLDGIYNVVSFVLNNDTLLPLTNSSIRWDKLIINDKKSAEVRLMNERIRYYSFTADTANKMITLCTYADTTSKSFLRYQRINRNQLVLRGIFNNDSIAVRMKKINLDDFPLMGRGFHLVNEFPPNQ